MTNRQITNRRIIEIARKLGGTFNAREIVAAAGPKVRWEASQSDREAQVNWRLRNMRSNGIFAGGARGTWALNRRSKIAQKKLKALLKASDDFSMVILGAIKHTSNEESARDCAKLDQLFEIVNSYIGRLCFEGKLGRTGSGEYLYWSALYGRQAWMDRKEYQRLIHFDERRVDKDFSQVSPRGDARRRRRA
jgi:hypothetical protein